MACKDESIKTRNKLTIARYLSRAVRIARRLCGYSNITICRRSGLRWELDLTEGIDLHIYLFGAFEPEIQRYASKIVRRGGTIVDIGANIGAHTLRFAKLVGRSGKVFAFEPTDYAFQKLARNIKLNPDLESCVYPRQEMLTASNKQIKPMGICSSWPLNEDDAVHAVHMGKAKSLNAACVTTLDNAAHQLGWSDVDLLKIDVDGNELFVLQGGKAFLMEKHPPILMEFAPYLYAEFGYNLSDLTQLLHSMGYRCQLLPSQDQIEFDKLTEHVGVGGSANVLLV